MHTISSSLLISYIYYICIVFLMRSWPITSVCPVMAYCSILYTIYTIYNIKITYKHFFPQKKFPLKRCTSVFQYLNMSSLKLDESIQTSLVSVCAFDRSRRQRCFAVFPFCINIKGWVMMLQRGRIRRIKPNSSYSPAVCVHKQHEQTSDEPDNCLMLLYPAVSCAWLHHG